MWQYKSYVHRLDSILNKIRAKYMGQEMRFTEMVSDGEKLPLDTLAKHVAQQLTAQLNRIDNLTDKELFDCYWWLRSATQYILQEVASEDHDLRNLVRLAKLSCDALTLLVGTKLPAKYADAIPYVPELIKENLEEAIWLWVEINEIQLKSLSNLVLSL